LVEVRLPPRARVLFDNPPRPSPLHQQVWLLDGALEIRLGDDEYTLAPGDCLAMVLDRPGSFHNPGRRTSRHLVAAAAGARVP
jgi:hypothetical protein